MLNELVEQEATGKSSNNMKFTESQLELAFITLLQDEDMVHQVGNVVRQAKDNLVEEPMALYGHFVSDQVLIIDDLKAYLRLAYKNEAITNTARCIVVAAAVI